MPQIIEYDGMNFYKCADGYYCNGKSQRLHRYKWEKEVGPIPAGCHIHHKDHDKDNNDLENYELLDGKEHLSHHGKNPERIAILLEYGEIGRVLAAEWHHTEEAREVSRKNWPKSLGLYMDKIITLKCEHCGKEFETTVFASWGSKFCGNNCKSKARRASRVDHVPRSCVVCGKEFMTDKYGKVLTCSNECQVKRNLFLRTGVMWGDGIDQSLEIQKRNAKTLDAKDINLSKLAYYKKCRSCGHEWKSNVTNQKKCPNCFTSEWDGGDEWLKLKLCDTPE
jgi:uncharacterized OB-fold protein